MNTIKNKNKKNKLLNKFLVASAFATASLGVVGGAFGAIPDSNKAGSKTSLAADWGTGAAPVANDTIKLITTNNVIADTDLSGGVTIDINSLADTDAATTITIGDGGNDGKLKINAINNVPANQKGLKIVFAKNSVTAGDNKVIITGDSTGKVREIDFVNQANSLVVLENNAKLSAVINSNGGANGIIQANQNFEIESSDFGNTGAIAGFEIFKTTAGGTGKIKFTGAAAANFGAPVTVHNDGSIEIINDLKNAGGNTETLTFSKDFDLSSDGNHGNSKTVTLTFKTSNKNADATPFDDTINAGDKIKNASKTSFVVDGGVLNLATSTANFAKDASGNAGSAVSLEVKNNGLVKLGEHSKFAKIKLGEEGGLMLAEAGKSYKLVMAADQAANTGGLLVDKDSTIAKDSTVFTKGLKGLVFVGDKTLTLEKEITEIKALSICTVGANPAVAGTIVAVDNLTISGNVGYDHEGKDLDPAKFNTIKAVTFAPTAAGKTLAFKDGKVKMGDFAVVGGTGNSGIDVNSGANEANVTFEGNSILTHITPIVASNEKVSVLIKDAGETDVKIAGIWGSNASKLKELKIDTKKDVVVDYNAKKADGADYTNSAITTKSINFITDVNFVAKADTLNTIEKVTNTDVKGGLINIDGDLDITDAKLKEFKNLARLGVNGNDTNSGNIKLGANLDASAVDFITLTNEKGKIEIGDKAKFKSVGSAEKKYLTAKIVGTNDFTYESGDIYARNIEVAGTGKLTFNKKLVGELDITNTGGVTFNSEIGNVTASAADIILGGTGKTGKISGTNNAVIAQELKFLAGTKREVSDIYVNKIVAEGTAEKPVELIVDGAVTHCTTTDSAESNVTYKFSKPTDSLKLDADAAAGKKHVYTGTLKFDLNTDGKTISKVSFDNAKVDVTGTTTVALSVNGLVDGLQWVDITTGTDTEKEAFVKKLSVGTSTNSFIDVKIDGLKVSSAAKNVYTIIGSTDFAKKMDDAKVSEADKKTIVEVSKMFDGLSKKNASAFIKIVGTDSAKEVENIKGFVTAIEGAAKAHSIIAKTSESLAQTISDTVNTRMTSLVAPASGDENPVSLGLYVQPFGSFGSSSDDKNKFSFSGGGFAMGSDAGFNEDNTIAGFAYTYASNKLKVKDSSDKTSAKVDTGTHAFSVYGAHRMSEGAFAEALVSYASTEITNKDSKDNKDKHKVRTILGRGLIGYAYNMDSVTLTPLVGAEFVNSKGGSFTKNVSDMQMNSKSANATVPSALFGVRAAFNIDSDGMKIVPYAGLMVKVKLGDKSNGDIIQSVEGEKGSYTYKTKASKLSFSPTVGVDMKQGQMTYSVSYTGNIASKYSAHNVGLKVKIGL